ncbi:hypothetical protein C8R44DRAFT_750574 [Mycena epipterygia]|nr:hypothetical protein C8R44DRAFT_750574 [Mycena epipterygia]
MGAFHVVSEMPHWNASAQLLEDWCLKGQKKNPGPWMAVLKAGESESPVYQIRALSQHGSIDLGDFTHEKRRNRQNTGFRQKGESYAGEGEAKHAAHNFLSDFTIILSSHSRGIPAAATPRRAKLRTRSLRRHTSALLPKGDGWATEPSSSRRRRIEGNVGEAGEHRDNGGWARYHRRDLRSGLFGRALCESMTYLMSLMGRRSTTPLFQAGQHGQLIGHVESAAIVLSDYKEEAGPCTAFTDAAGNLAAGARRVWGRLLARMSFRRGRVRDLLMGMPGGAAHPANCLRVCTMFLSLSPPDTRTMRRGRVRRTVDGRRHDYRKCEHRAGLGWTRSGGVSGQALHAGRGQVHAGIDNGGEHRGAHVRRCGLWAGDAVRCPHLLLALLILEGARVSKNEHGGRDRRAKHRVLERLLRLYAICRDRSRCGARDGSQCDREAANDRDERWRCRANCRPSTVCVPSHSPLHAELGDCGSDGEERDAAAPAYPATTMMNPLLEPSRAGARADANEVRAARAIRLTECANEMYRKEGETRRSGGSDTARLAAYSCGRRWEGARMPSFTKRVPCGVGWGRRKMKNDWACLLSGCVLDELECAGERVGPSALLSCAHDGRHAALPLPPFSLYSHPWPLLLRWYSAWSSGLRVGGSCRWLRELLVFE